MLVLPLPTELKSKWVSAAKVISPSVALPPAPVIITTSPSFVNAFCIVNVVITADAPLEVYI